MAGQDVPAAIVLSAARRCRSRHRLRNPRSGAPAATDRLALSPTAIPPAARPRPRSDAGLVYGGEVSFLNLPSHHSITSSARASGVGGTAKPRTEASIT